MKRYDPELSGPCPGLAAATMEESQDGEYVKVDDVLAVIKGCWDYGGGYRGEPGMEAYRHGMQTVLNAMNGALKSEPSDHQSNAVLAMGRKANETGIHPNGEPVR